MRLLLNPLTDELFQQMTATKNCNLAAIRPHLYKHNTPTGMLQIELRDENGKTIKQSNAININDIPGLPFTETFFHGYIRFDLDYPIKEGLIYQIALVSSGGYSFSESNYIGWCMDYDLRKYQASYTPNAGLDSAYDLELWDKKEL